MKSIKNLIFLGLLFFTQALLFFKISLATFSEEHSKMLRNCTLAIVAGNENQIEELILKEKLFHKNSGKIEISHGTGFYYSENIKIPKRIITNFHVVEPAILDSSNSVFGCSKQGESYNCFKLELLMIDKKNDLSLLLGENLSCKENLTLENDFPETSNVSAYGNKFGMGLSFFRGIISAKKVKVSENENEVYHFLDMNVNYGNSGGPIFIVNTNKIVGIFKSIYNSRSESSSGIPFAITAETIKKSLTRMENILEFEKDFDFKIEEEDGKFLLTHFEKKFLQDIQPEQSEELYYIEKNPIKTKLQAIYLFYEFIESDKKEINIVLSNKKKLRSLKIHKIESLSNVDTNL